MLGNRLAEQGDGVRMATHVIRLMVQDQPFWLSFRNQLRWMQSTRRSRPWGHLRIGAYVRDAVRVAGAGVGVAERPRTAGLVWLAGMVLNRWLQAGTILRRDGRHGLGARNVALSTAGSAGLCALGGELWWG